MEAAQKKSGRKEENEDQYNYEEMSASTYSRRDQYHGRAGALCFIPSNPMRDFNHTVRKLHRTSDLTNRSTGAAVGRGI